MSGPERLRAPALLVLAALLFLVGCAGGGHDAGPAAARRDAAAFLARYERPDGRIARTDQGDDTVSEGQSYGLLLAEVAGDRARLAAIWAWTKGHLLRDDGLLAYHADASGHILDRSAATDADLVTAWALVRAGSGFRPAGVAMARAVLDRETAHLPNGGLLLAAGDWATGQPTSLNPSYWALPAMTALAKVVPDPRWDGIIRTTDTTLAGLTAGGARLPPDWARADGNIVTPTPSPSGTTASVQYSFDAQRAVVWMAVSGAARHGAFLSILDHPPAQTAQTVAPDGSVIDPAPSPVAAIASAAADAAAGRTADRDRLLAAAARLDAAHPTYYGSAWVALGEALLTTHLLSGSPS